MIIAIFNEDRNLDRSVLATSLAVACTSSQNRVALIDATANGHSLSWCVRRAGTRVKPRIAAYAAETVRADFSDALSPWRRRYRDIVIDVDGRSSLHLETMLLAADVLVVPKSYAQLSSENARESDLRFAERIGKISLFNPSLKILIVEMRAAGREEAAVDNTAEKLAALLPGAVPADTVIHKTAVAALAYDKGLCVLDGDKQRLGMAAEIDSLRKEIRDMENSPQTTNIATLTKAIHGLTHWH
ncbi:MAG: hypothetical protein JO269_06425 [Burkholderiaceae bacterium]|nr:hypothetical protein [Burkholderiaceae bacterium]